MCYLNFLFHNISLDSTVYLHTFNDFNVLMFLINILKKNLKYFDDK